MKIYGPARAALAITLLSVLGIVYAAESPTYVTVQRGATRVLVAGDCVQPVNEAASAAVHFAKVADGPEYAVLHATAKAPVQPLVLRSGGKPADSKGNCTNAVEKTFIVTLDSSPQVAEGATTNALAVLMQAFVLALLLEQGFALFFNWRLVQEFLVGRAWRTPIMFAVSYALVSSLDMDLMASLLKVYSPVADASAPTSTWLTRAVTAMILAGGSVGVNQILVNLGVRTPVRDAAATPTLDMTEAWVAVEVSGLKSSDGQVQVNFNEVIGLNSEELAKVPTIAGVARQRGIVNRLTDVFLPSLTRVPRSGGRKVDATKVYRITVRSTVGGNDSFRDLTGKKIASPELAPAIRFAPRAIVDLWIAVV